METFQIPRRKIAEHLGVSRSTLYRWLRTIQDDDQTRIPANKTPKEIAALIWEITKTNISWGRVRIANQLALLNVFISASTVRNILQRPAPDKTPAAATTTQKETEDTAEPKSIPAWYPNHVWSIDTTKLYCWGLWPVEVCVVIDHFSRKVMSAMPLEGPNAGWISNALGDRHRKVWSAPTHNLGSGRCLYRRRLCRPNGATEYHAASRSHRKTRFNFGDRKSDQDLEI